MSSPPLVPDDIEPIDRTHLARMTLGDLKLEREVLSLFVKQAANLLPRIGRRDDDLRRLVHTVKGSAQGIGAFAVVEAAICLEQAVIEDCDFERAFTELARAIDEAQTAIEGILQPV
jgi:HPt (histidine-containing phosphotransfer) domain-containing protein